MNSRELLVLVLRAMGCWMFLRALTALPMAMTQFFYFLSNLGHGTTAQGPGQSAWGIFAAVCLQTTAELVLGIFMMLAAKRLASFLCKADGDDESQKTIAIQSLDLYRVFSRLLGVYAILWGIPPLARSIGTFATARKQSRAYPKTSLSKRRVHPR